MSCASVLTSFYRVATVSQLTQSQSYALTDAQSASLSWCHAPFWGQRADFIIVIQLRVWGCGTPSLTRGWVCRLQLLLTLASAN
jgi:hypothetical protein